MEGDEAIRKPVTHEIGIRLDSLSIEELASRIGLLEQEIERLRAAISGKQSSRQAADSVFKL